VELVRPVVVLCPPLELQPLPAWHDPLLAALAGAGLPVIAPAPAPVIDADPRVHLAGWVANQSIAIAAAGTPGPLLLVAAGSAGRGLPALGMAQRASRHAVVGYVLVDGAAPDAGRSGQDWPDAPVTLVHTPGSVQQANATARLRGWAELHADPVTLVPELVRRWPEPLPGRPEPDRAP
jgi:hypothetical protein